MDLSFLPLLWVYKPIWQELNWFDCRRELTVYSQKKRKEEWWRASSRRSSTLRWNAVKCCEQHWFALDYIELDWIELNRLDLIRQGKSIQFCSSLVKRWSMSWLSWAANGVIQLLHEQHPTTHPLPDTISSVMRCILSPDLVRYLVIYLVLYLRLHNLIILSNTNWKNESNWLMIMRRNKKNRRVGNEINKQKRYVITC